MKDRPILFSGPMVRAVLDGTKTQTRRVVKGAALDWLERDGFTPEFVALPENRMCPYGQPGDRLWVREAWARTRVFGAEMVVYREGDNRTCYGGPWKPSIHMPRHASRITLEVLGVRVERLQDISEADAMAEGITYGPTFDEEGRSGGYHWDRSREDEDVYPTAVQAFRQLWMGINGTGSWDANPWVWVPEFRRIAVEGGVA